MSYSFYNQTNIMNQNVIINHISEDEIRIKKELSDTKEIIGDNMLKIELFPKNISIDSLDKLQIQFFISDAIGHSLDPNKDLAFLLSKVPLLSGLYAAHCNH